MNCKRFAIFFTVFTSVMLTWHFYLWVRLVLDTEPGPLAMKLLTGLFALAAIGVPVFMITGRKSKSRLVRYLALIPYTWLGAGLLVFTVLVLGDVAKIFLPAGHDPVHYARIVALIAATYGFFAVIFGSRNALTPTTVRTEVTLKRLPAAFDGFRIVQLSDVHIGPTLKRDWLEKVVKQVNDLSPDLIVITGDLVDGEPEHMAEELASLKDLSAPHGVHYVTGNHEHFYDADGWVDEVRKLGLKPLRSEHVRIEKDGTHFTLAGVDDIMSKHFDTKHKTDFDKALAGAHPDHAIIMLCHQPKPFLEAVKRGVDLMISGHTHGGQIFPFTLFVRLDSKWIRGLHRHEESQIYVHDGTGFWGPPLRVGTRSEVAELILKSTVKN